MAPTHGGRLARLQIVVGGGAIVPNGPVRFSNLPDGYSSRVGLGRPADVTVQLAGQPSRTVAFEIFITGEEKEVRGVLRDVELFEEIVVCAQTGSALESLEKRARDSRGDPALRTVSFELISKYLLLDSARKEPSRGSVVEGSSTRPWRPRRSRSGTDQHLKPDSDVEKMPQNQTQKQNQKKEDGPEGGPEGSARLP